MALDKKLHWLCAAVLLAAAAPAQTDFNRNLKIELKPAAAPADLRRDAVVVAVESAMPSVVNVATENIRTVSDPMQELMQQFWNPYYQRRETDSPYSLGSGVVISDDGFLLTNDHVIQRANKIWIKLATGGKVYEAKLVASDANKDLALLKIAAAPGEKFTAIKFAPDDDLLLGETVLALGNPFNLGGSVSRGILSSKNRVDAQGEEKLNLYNCLQTDAAINPGNSGGPLVNLRGELIGVNAAILKDAQGIGFAIPVKQINTALASLVTPESARQLWFGAHVKIIGGQLVINAVQPGSPAENAGLKIGDTITQLNNHAPKGILDFNQSLIDSPQGKASLWLARNATALNSVVQLVPENSFFNADLVRKKLGVTLSEQKIPTQVAANLHLASTNVLVVTDVETNAPAAKSLLRGFLVTTIDGQISPDLMTAAKLLYAKKSGATAQLGVLAQMRQDNFTYTTQDTLAIPVR